MFKEIFLPGSPARIRGNNSGSTLIPVMLITAALLFLGFSMVRLYRTSQYLATKAENTLVAMAAASAGIDEAFFVLKRDPVWQQGFVATRLPHSGATFQMTFNRIQTSLPYSTNNAAGVVPAVGYGGRLIPPGMVHLIAQGEYGRGWATEEALVTPTGKIVVRARW